MNTNLIEKINLIRKINTDDSNFIVRVFEAYQKNQNEIENKKKTTTIKLLNEKNKLLENVINLDKIWVKPYFYNRMRVSLDTIISLVSVADKNEIISNPNKLCKKIIFNKKTKEFTKSEEEIDIVEFIQVLDERKKINSEENFDFTFIAKEINEETLFKEEQLKKAIEIINITNLKERNEQIYNEVYFYLKKDFVANNYCDFRNNKCVAQRHISIYPINRKNGCCFTQVRTCPHLNNGNCNVECLACRLFSCPYLTKRGVGYWANEIILLKAFYTKQQRKHVIFDFYKSKTKVLENINKEVEK